MASYKTEFNEQSESKFHTSFNSGDDVFEKILNSIKTPYIGENGNWYEWDVKTQTFIDTGIKGVGKDGEPGEPGKDGVDGNDYVLTDADKQEIANMAIIDQTYSPESQNAQSGVAVAEAVANIGGQQISPNHIEALTDDLTESYVDGKYAISFKGYTTYDGLSCGIANIANYENIIVMCYTKPSSQLYPIIFCTETETIQSGSYTEWETIDEDLGIYKIKVPEGATIAKFNVHTNKKEYAYCKGVVYPKKHLNWLQVESDNIDESVVKEVVDNISNIKPNQISFAKEDFDIVDVEPLTSKSGYYHTNDKGNKPTFNNSSKHFEFSVFSGQKIRCYLTNANISDANLRNFFCVVDNEGKCTDFPNIIRLDNNEYEFVVPDGGKTCYLTYGGSTYWVKTIINSYEIDWLSLKTENFKPNTIPQNALIETVKPTEYKYGDSLNKPFNFNGKHIVAFGDSITSGVTSPNLQSGTPYIKHFADHVGATLKNYAVSGTCISDTVNTYSIYNKILSCSDAADFIFISGGTNDFNTNKELGTYSDTDTTTFYGCLKAICEHISENFADSEVIFITPIPYTSASRYHNATNDSGYTLNDYRNAIYEIATLYDFNVVDGSNLGMPDEKGNWSNDMCDDSDGCHPSAKGHKLYARNLAGKLC